MDRVAGRASLSVMPNGVGFSKQTISRLGYPHFVQIYISHKEKVVGIKACDKEDYSSIKFVPENQQRVDSIRWNNAEFLKDFKSLINDEMFLKFGFKVDGEYILDENAFLFDFKKAYLAKRLSN